MAPKALTTEEKITKTRRTKKIDVEQNVDVEKNLDVEKYVDVEKNVDMYRNEVNLKNISFDKNNISKNLSEDNEENFLEKPQNFKTNSKFYIHEDHYLNLDKTKFSEYSNTDLTSLLFLRLLNSGNPLAKFVISIHRALVDPVNSNLQNLENYRQVLTGRTENNFRNKEKYNKNKEYNFENSQTNQNSQNGQNYQNSQGYNRFRKNTENNVSREGMLVNSLEIEPENKPTYRRNFNRIRSNE